MQTYTLFAYMYNLSYAKTVESDWHKWLSFCQNNVKDIKNLPFPSQYQTWYNLYYYPHSIMHLTLTGDIIVCVCFRYLSYDDDPFLTNNLIYKSM